MNLEATSLFLGDDQLYRAAQNANDDSSLLTSVSMLGGLFLLYRSPVNSSE